MTVQAAAEPTKGSKPLIEVNKQSTCGRVAMIGARQNRLLQTKLSGGR
jgi:hypothetical protein